jgi:dTDP-glucose 4,6-dehydratase
LITHALQGKILPIYGDGQNIRDWLYVEDHCRGIELVLTKGCGGEVYNIGGNNEQTNTTIARHICRLIDEAFAVNPNLKKQFSECPASKNLATATLIRFVTDRPGHDHRYAINAKKIQQKLGYQPSETLESGLKKTVQWYLDHWPWWHHSNPLPEENKSLDNSHLYA